MSNFLSKVDEIVVTHIIVAGQAEYKINFSWIIQLRKPKNFVKFEYIHFYAYKYMHSNFNYMWSNFNYLGSALINSYSYCSKSHMFYSW